MIWKPYWSLDGAYHVSVFPVPTEVGLAKRRGGGGGGGGGGGVEEPEEEEKEKSVTNKM